MQRKQIVISKQWRQSFLICRLSVLMQKWFPCSQSPSHTLLCCKAALCILRRLFPFRHSVCPIPVSCPLWAFQSVPLLACRLGRFAAWVRATRHRLITSPTTSRAGTVGSSLPYTRIKGFPQRPPKSARALRRWLPMSLPGKSIASSQKAWAVLQGTRWQLYHGEEAEGRGHRDLFWEERLLYGESSEECGKMGIPRNFLVFRWCYQIEHSGKEMNDKFFGY